jgi:hypothetical protein
MIIEQLHIFMTWNEYNFDLSWKSIILIYLIKLINIDTFDYKFGKKLIKFDIGQN